MRPHAIWMRAAGVLCAVYQIAQASSPISTCSSCRTILGNFQGTANQSDQALITELTGLCKALHAADNDVCDGIMVREGPILAHDLRNMTIPSKTSDIFCLNLFGVCDWPAVDTSGTPALPAKNTKKPPVRPKASKKKSKKVAHFSDIHVDLSYTVGASYECTKNICCRPYDGSLAPGNNSYPAGPYGNHNCDAPASLEASMYTAVANLKPKPDFSIFTGDVVEGAVWLVTEDEVTNDLANAYNSMRHAGLTYAAPGNHDSSPVNSFPPPDLVASDNYTWVYDTYSKDVGYWVGGSTAKHIIAQSGSYSILAKKEKKLRIISLNTNFWYVQNFWMYERTMQHDPAGLLAWLVGELASAEKKKERVWIIGHIPMGSNSVFYDQSYYFDAIVQRFSATIASMFFGHTHQDEFEISYTNYTNRNFNTASMISYIAPSLTPTSGNPTFRVYDVDPVTYAVRDYTVYYANISSPTYQTAGPSWQKLYSVKEAYGSLLNPPYTDPNAELTPAFWHNVTELFESNVTVFNEYYARKGRNFYNATQLACDSDCQKVEICQLRAAQSQYNCYVATPGINFKRSVAFGESLPGGHAHGDDCDHSPLVGVLSAAFERGLLLQ